jgi:hypothetical protein
VPPCMNPSSCSGSSMHMVLSLMPTSGATLKESATT